MVVCLVRLCVGHVIDWQPIQGDRLKTLNRMKWVWKMGGNDLLSPLVKQDLANLGMRIIKEG